MTFTEAAVEILRLVGRPLHYKKITKLAIERNLLSHIGKAPELTMSSRLATMVKKDRGNEPIIKVKPGVFALREFAPEVLALGDSEEDIDLSALPPPEPRGVVSGAGGTGGPDGEGGRPSSSRLRIKLGSDVFPREEDDDEPILAGLDDQAEEDEEKDERAEGHRRGRRRRRAGEAEGDGAVAAEREAKVEDREGGRSREPDRDREMNRDRYRDRERDRGRGSQGIMQLPEVELARVPQNDGLLGRDLADAVFSILASGEAVPLTYVQIAEQLVRRGRVVGDPAALAPAVSAAIRADSRRRVRTRFRYYEGRVALYDWWLPREAVRQEREAERFAERQRVHVRRAFLRRLQELPATGFVEILATWLNAEGVSGLRAIRRPGSSSHEIHLAGLVRRGPEEMRIAVVALRDGREVLPERVTELRGSLPHYGDAVAAWIVSTGPVSPAARQEASVPGGSPIALFDGMALAEAMEVRGVGLVPVPLMVSTIDLDLLDALRGSPEPMLRGSEQELHRNRPQEAQGPSSRGPELTGTDPATAGSVTRSESGSPEVGAAPIRGETERERERGRRRRHRRRRGHSVLAASGESSPGGSAETPVDTDQGDVDDEGTGERSAFQQPDLGSQISAETGATSDDDVDSSHARAGEGKEGHPAAVVAHRDEWEDGDVKGIVDLDEGEDETSDDDEDRGGGERR